MSEEGVRLNIDGLDCVVCNNCSDGPCFEGFHPEACPRRCTHHSTGRVAHWVDLYVVEGEL